jgi:phosphoribosylglycinamide formyltransferase-1
LTFVAFSCATSASIIESYPNKIVNIHPALAQNTAEKEYVQVNVHRAVIERNKERNRNLFIMLIEITMKGNNIFQKKVATITDTPEWWQKKYTENWEQSIF